MRFSPAVPQETAQLKAGDVPEVQVTLDRRQVARRDVTLCNCWATAERPERVGRNGRDGWGGTRLAEKDSKVQKFISVRAAHRFNAAAANTVLLVSALYCLISACRAPAVPDIGQQRSPKHSAQTSACALSGALLQAQHAWGLTTSRERAGTVP